MLKMVNTSSKPSQYVKIMHLRIPQTIWAKTLKIYIKRWRESRRESERVWGRKVLLYSTQWPLWLCFSIPCFALILSRVPLVWWLKIWAGNQKVLGSNSLVPSIKSHYCCTLEQGMCVSKMTTCTPHLNLTDQFGCLPCEFQMDLLSVFLFLNNSR